MPRKPSFTKKLKDIVDSLVSQVVGGKQGKYRSGKPSLSAGTYKNTIGNLGNNRIRTEKPTRNLPEFAFIMDILSSSPAINSALRKLSEDAALDENGDIRAWSLVIKTEIDDDDQNKEDLRKNARELRRTLQIIFENYTKRTGIGYNTKHYIYKTLSAGDCFAEQEIDLDVDSGLGQIARIKELPTWQMRPIKDDDGELIAYEQWRSSNEKNPIRWNVPAQIIHWKNHAVDYMDYGDTIMTSFQNRWEAFKLMELDLLAAIHTKAVSPEVHKVGSIDNIDKATPEQLEEYEQKLRDNPADINRFYVVAQGEVEIEFPKVSGDHQAIKVLADVHRDIEGRFVTALGVPGLLAGNTKDVSTRRAATSIDQDYARRIASIRGDFAHYLYASVALEFALHGYDFDKPEKYGIKNITFAIDFPDVGETRGQRSTRLLDEWTKGAIPLEAMLRQNGDPDPEGTMQILEEEHNRGIFPLDILAKREAIASKNDNQGPGVSSDNTDPKDEGTNEKKRNKE